MPGERNDQLAVIDGQPQTAIIEARPAPPIPYQDIERMAKAIAGSKLFGIQNETQAIALCLIAQAEGRHPASAAMDYHIIQNRPALTADAILARHLANGGRVRWGRYDDECVEATFSHPAGGEVTISWDTARAQKAGLLGKDNWQKYPRQMRRARCISEGVHTVNPGAINGMYAVEEVADFEPFERQRKLAEADDLEATAEQLREDAPASYTAAQMDERAAKLRKAADDLQPPQPASPIPLGAMITVMVGRGKTAEGNNDPVYIWQAAWKDPQGKAHNFVLWCWDLQAAKAATLADDPATFQGYVAVTLSRRKQSKPNHYTAETMELGVGPVIDMDAAQTE